jgi:putative endonuclease
MYDGLFHEYWMYIMASPSGTLYTGVTGDIFKRVQQHKLGLVEGFSKKYGCTRLVYYESYDQVGRAIGREKQIKGWRRSKKIALIEGKNPRWEDLAEHWGREMRFRGQSLKKTP